MSCKYLHPLFCGTEMIRVVFEESEWNKSNWLEKTKELFFFLHYSLENWITTTVQIDEAISIFLKTWTDHNVNQPITAKSRQEGKIRQVKYYSYSFKKEKLIISFMKKKEENNKLCKPCSNNTTNPTVQLSISSDSIIQWMIEYTYCSFNYRLVTQLFD